jgi:hypothetical protein
VVVTLYFVGFLASWLPGIYGTGWSTGITGSIVVIAAIMIGVQRRAFKRRLEFEKPHDVRFRILEKLREMGLAKLKESMDADESDGSKGA